MRGAVVGLGLVVTTFLGCTQGVEQRTITGPPEPVTTAPHTPTATAVAPTAPATTPPRRTDPSARPPLPPPPPSPADHGFAARSGDPAAVPLLPDDPAAIGRLLANAERAVREERTNQQRLLAAARTVQAAYRRLGPRREWDALVLAQVPVDLRSAVIANLKARRELTSIGGSAARRDSIPAWRIVAPAPEADLLRFYREAQAEFGVGWEYLAAMNLVETTMGRIRGLSSAGARGPMQFIPETWARFGRGNIDDPRDSILAAGRYLSASGFATNIDRALYAYNPTAHYGAAVQALASVLAEDERAYAGYYRWDVYIRAAPGAMLLPIGFDATAERLSASAYLARYPQRRA